MVGLSAFILAGGKVLTLQSVCCLSPGDLQCFTLTLCHTRWKSPGARGMH